MICQEILLVQNIEKQPAIDKGKLDYYNNKWNDDVQITTGDEIVCIDKTLFHREKN